MQTLKKSEYGVRVLRADSNAIILDGETPIPIDRSRGDPNVRRFRTPILDRVANQILK
jgi:hypothetical protein